MGYQPGKGLGKNAQGGPTRIHIQTNKYVYWYCTVDFLDLMACFFVTGIVNPIEAKVRKGKGAVGAYGNERTQQSLQDFPVVDSEEEEEKVHLS